MRQLIVWPRDILADVLTTATASHLPEIKLSGWYLPVAGMRKSLGRLGVKEKAEG